VKSSFTESNTSYLTNHPFGMGMPGRSWSAASAEGYRFGYNGKEGDGEIKGKVNSLDFGSRIYDPRIAKWMSADPERQLYPSFSPYSYAINSPIVFIDPVGKWIAKVKFDGENYYLAFEAEDDDNLETLCTQLGIPKESILKVETNLETTVITTGTEILLSNVQAVKDINSSINSISTNQDSWNCADFAASCTGSELDPQWTTSGNNIEDFATILKNSYVAVEEKDTKIGTVIHYRIDPALIEATAIKLVDNRLGNIARANGVSEGEYIASYKLEFPALYELKIEDMKETLANERHFVVVILKDKSGTEIVDVAQKRGKLAFTFTIEREEDVNKSLPYIQQPIEGTKTSTYNNE